MNCYYLLYAVLGEFEADLHHRQVAMKHFRKALELATMKSEQIFLTRKIQELNDTPPTKPKRLGGRVMVSKMLAASSPHERRPGSCCRH